MAKAGEVIENPVSGERIVFRQVAEDNNGAFVEFDQYLAKGGGYTAEHIHLVTEERYEVISGIATYSIESVAKTAKVGEVVDIKPGTIHVNPWNNNTEELHLLRTDTPEGGLEIFYETQYGLARDGKALKSGDMNLLQTIVIGNAIKSETYFYPKTLPIFLQKLLVPVLAFIGRLLGYKPRYPEYSG
ncbi:MAG: hypothetical protein ABI947_18740 [Chloroflexota bacterium]